MTMLPLTPQLLAVVVAIAPRPQPALLRARLLDSESREPLAGVSARISTSADSVLSDSLGRIRLELPRGEKSITLLLRGGNRYPACFVVDVRRRVTDLGDLLLERAGEFRGAYATCAPLKGK
jgi:hypothetical protein